MSFLLLLTASVLISMCAAQTFTTVTRAEDIALTLPPRSGNLEIYALPVGQGDCTIIQCPNGNLIVNDCGSSGGNRVSAQQVQNFLGNRIGDTVAILISHPDRDHFNYLNNITWTTSIKAVIIGATLNDYNRSSSEFIAIYKWLTVYNNAGLLYTVNGGVSCIGTCTVPPGTNFCSSLNIRFDILAANVGTTSNQKSIVMKVTLGGFSLLSPGDMEGKAATTIATSGVGAQLRSFLYKIAHHGASSQANSVTWLTPISPIASFASQGYNFGNCKHPRCDCINRLINLGSLRTTSSHDIYCGNTGAPTPLLGFNSDIYLTSPSSNMICFLNYTVTSTLNLTTTCNKVLEEPDRLGDDECPQPEDLEEEEEEEEESSALATVTLYVHTIIAIASVSFVLVV